MKVEQTSLFKKDFKRCKKKHYDVSKIKKIVILIVKGEKERLIRKYKDHGLTGNWQGFRELHIEKD